MKLVAALPSLGDPAGTKSAGYAQADLDAAHVYVAEEDSTTSEGGARCP